MVPQRIKWIGQLGKAMTLLDWAETPDQEQAAVEYAWQVMRDEPERD